MLTISPKYFNIISINKWEANYERYNSLLSKELVNEIYYTNLKKEIFRYFDKLNDSKTYYTLGMYSSSSFGFNSEIKTSSPISRVEKYVENQAKYEAFTNTFYLKLKNLSQILTYEEAIYLTETFFQKIQKKEFQKN